MTFGINNKNKLYIRLVQADKKNNFALFNTLKTEYQLYCARLRRTIREAKRMLYGTTFLLYKNYISKTWDVINDTLQRKSLFWKTKSSWKLMYGLSRYNTLVTNTYNIHNNKCN